MVTNIIIALFVVFGMLIAPVRRVGPPAFAASSGGYWLVNSRMAVWPFGSASSHVGPAGSPSPNAPVVGAAGLPGRVGLWEVAADGGVFDFGNVDDPRFHGSAANLHLNARIVGMAVTPDGRGYWLAGADGGVFSFGNARFFGSMAGKRLNAPIVGIAAMPTGAGYELVAADGGVFTFGDAICWGCEVLPEMNAPVVGIVATPGPGYYLVAADGGVFPHGPHSPDPPVGARFFGSLGGSPLQRPIVGMVTTADVGGYWLVAADGGVFGFGDAAFAGSAVPQHPTVPFTAIVASP
jgi:hypothetical protein